MEFKISRNSSEESSGTSNESYVKVDQFESERSLFEDKMSSAFRPGAGNNQGEANVPAAYQSTSNAAAEREPQQVGGTFETLYKDITSAQLHQIIQEGLQTFDPKTYVDGIKYQGFNREEFINSSISRITASQMVRFAVMGAIRGANYEKIEKSSASIDVDLKNLVSKKVVVRNAKKTNDITILRCTSAVPQWAAYIIGNTGIVKKLPNLACPSWMQFPAAASLPMSGQLRMRHIEFSIAFSKVIGGSFNENIYMAMFNNQLDISQIPDELRVLLDIRTTNESLNVDVANMIAESMRSMGR